MESKKVLQLVIAIIVGMSFIVSLLTFSNLGGNTQGKSQPQKGSSVPPTVYGVGFSNATITGYGDTMNISVGCAPTIAANASSIIGATVAAMERNNSIYNSYSLGNETVVQAGTSGVSSIYSVIRGKLNQSSSACVSFSSEALVALRPSIEMTISNRTFSITIPQNLSEFSVPVTLSDNMSSMIGVRVAALVESNGTAYSLNVTRAK